MKPLPAIDVTSLLQAWQAGEAEALGKLMELVYQDLRHAAHRYMVNERLSHTLQTTALIHEAYLRLIGFKRLQFQDRAHFLAICARLMRQILIDFARQRRSDKRGGGQVHVSLDSAPQLAAAFLPDLVAIDGALAKLAEIDERKAK